MSGPDAWLAKRCVEYARQAREARQHAEHDPASAGRHQAVAEVYEAAVGAMRHLRTTGTSRR